MSRDMCVSWLVKDPLLWKDPLSAQTEVGLS